jgi:Tol biopolymer transport system component
MRGFAGRLELRLRSACVLALVVASMLAASQSSAALMVGRLRVRTLATVPDMLGFAQDQRYLAWLVPGRDGYVGSVVMLDLRTGMRTRVPPRAEQGDFFGCKEALELSGPELSGNRAYWEQWCGSIGNTDEADGDLVSAAVPDRKLRDVDSDSGFAPDAAVPPVGDGTSVYFYEGGVGAGPAPVVRYDGLAQRRVTGSFDRPVALAAGGGRLAVQMREYDRASSPAWSPDGRHVAYVRFDREIWLVNIDGSNRHRIVAYGTNPDWSPDGTKLAYGGPRDALVIANADGSNPRALTNGSDPAWAPTGNELAFVDHGEIWTIGLNGQNRQRAIADGQAPDWSPDGKRLVFIRGVGDLAVANADGSNERTIDSGDQAESPAWSPDGSEIAFTAPDDSGAANIYTIHPDGTGGQLISSDDGVTNSYDPAWGPSNQLLFVDDSQGDPHVFTSPANVFTSPANRQVTSASSTTPIVVYTRDGRLVATIKPKGKVLAFAVSNQVAAALLRDARGGKTIEIYQPVHRVVRVPSSIDPELAAAGAAVVFHVGDDIDLVDARRGSPHILATDEPTATGLSIVGRRVVWADGVLINALMLP